MEELCAMIRTQDNYPSRCDLQPLRSVSVQRRAEILPEPGRPAQTTPVEETAFCTDPQRASGASTRRRWPNGRNPRPAGLTFSPFGPNPIGGCFNRCCKKESWGHDRISEDPRPAPAGPTLPPLKSPLYVEVKHHLYTSIQPALTEIPAENRPWSTIYRTPSPHFKPW